MEKTEIKKILKFYKSIYPNSKLSELNIETVNSWYLMFEDYSYEQVQRAIIKFSKSNKYIPNLAEIISNIEVPDYTIEKIPPNTVIIQFEDGTYGNFPFRFLNSQDAKEYSKKFQECNYDKESIKILHEEHVRKCNSSVLTYRGEVKVRLEQKLQNQNNKGSRRYDKQSSFSW
nr:replicative helicase loader/inhibitor [uncultured Faecalibacillus sp.]